MTMVDDRNTSIALPGDPAFEAATQVFNLFAPARPAAAVTAHTIDQIRAAIRYAESEGLPVRVHATGHASAAVRPMHGAVLIRTRMSGGVDIDAQRRVARIPAGTRWGEVVEAAAAHGLAAPHGSSPTVGAVGYLLRGGLSFYGRKVGLAVNSVRAIELVTADGELRRVNASSDPELFWALRGGGGGFGVVTAVEIDLFPAAQVITGAAFWPAVHAERLLSAWRRWTLDAPREVTTSLRVMNLPPLPQIPPALAAGPVVSVDGAVLSATGDSADARRHAEDLLGPLRSVADPVLDTWQLTTTSAVLQAHMDPTDPIPVVGDHMLLGELGDDGAAAFLRVVGEGSGSPLVVAGLRQLGGAYSTPSPAGGALDHLDAHYSYAGSGAAFDPDTAEALKSHCAKVRTALGPWDTGRTTPSFVESFEQPQRHLSPERVRIADRVRARVDPSGRFRDDIAPNATALP
ncbi:FAD-binding oxidoreductase [Streptosporangium sp. NPDC000396]|uniref:FAD-binding oxidoreductase n=1 Tax=Streptosporangium sp. NPDC000396 TaxID=3366185 RepID=UPI0036A41D33